MTDADEPVSGKDREVELSVIIPAYNEEARLGPTLGRVFPYLADLDIAFEVVVVDDGSKDSTAQVARGFQADHPELSIVSNVPNRGKGYSVRRGMLGAKGRLRLFTDADLSTPIDELAGFLAYAGEYDVVFASRGMKESKVERTWFRRARGRIFGTIVSTFIIRGIHDSQCGFKLFRAEAAQLLFSQSVMDGWTFDVEILLMAQKAGLKLKEVPVSWRDAEGSKVKPLDSFAMLAQIWKIKKRVGEMDLGTGGR